MGRYILRKEEFSEIPESNSGFFSMSGEIVNDLGKVGNIQLIYQKTAVEKTNHKSQTSKADLLRQKLKFKKQLKRQELLLSAGFI